MSKIKLLIFVILITGCSKKEDPLNKINFGVTNVTDFSKIIPTDLIKFKGKSTIPESFKEMEFTYKIPYADSILKYDLILNPDLYDFGKVRHLKISIPEEVSSFFMGNSDSVTIKLKKDILFKKLVEYYGEPDTISIKKSFDNTKFTFQKKYLVWKNSNYTVRMEPPSSMNKYSDETEVFYEMNELEKELSKIKDSITNNQTVNALIQPLRINCYWKDINSFTKEFCVQIPSIVRKDTYDDREITSIRFNLKVQDEFKKTLYEAKELTSKIDPPLYRQNFEYSLGGSSILLTTKYDIRSKNAYDLENARNYKKNNKLNYIAENVQLVLSDGTVIK